MVNELVSICWPETSCICGCAQPLIIDVPLGSKSNTDKAKVSKFAKAAWLSAAPTTAVSSKRTFIRLPDPPMLAGVRYGLAGTSTRAGGVICSLGNAYTTRPAALRLPARAVRRLTKSAIIRPSY